MLWMAPKGLDPRLDLGVGNNAVFVIGDGNVLYNPNP
jgi:hypothetical protein